jgi:hypothetical protein
VLEPALLVDGGGTGQGPQPLVDLQRIGRDRQRFLPAFAQQLCNGNRNSGLADGRRAEQR